MKEPKPIVSVILSASGKGSFLREAVESILKQEFQNFEMLIMNDGNSGKIEEELAQFSDPRIRKFTREPSEGLSAALNLLFSFAEGKYIARMDADDISLPSRFSDQVWVLDQNDDLLLIGSWAEQFSAEKANTLLDLPVTFDEIIFEQFFRSPFIHPAVMIRRTGLLNEKGPYNSEFRFSQDYDLFTRLLEKGRSLNIPKPLLQYRLHPEQSTSRHRGTQIECHMKILDSILARHNMGGLLADELKRYHAAMLAGRELQGTLLTVRKRLYGVLLSKGTLKKSAELDQYVAFTSLRDCYRSKAYLCMILQFIPMIFQRPRTLKYMLPRIFRKKQLQAFTQRIEEA